jgi:hypothetical protein
MRRKSAALIALLVLVTVIITTISSSSRIGGANKQQVEQLKEKEKRQRLTFKEQAQLAKARGQQKVTVPGIATLYPGASSPEELNETLSAYTIVVAQPVQQKSSVSRGGQEGQESPPEMIKSWYRFRILEVIRQSPPAPSFAVREIPREMLPVGGNEILVPKEGGSVLIDGVEVSQRDEDVPDFKLHGKYLLLLSLNPSTRVGELALGPQSVMALNDDGALGGHEEHILGRVLNKFHGGSVRKLKESVGK